MLSAVPRPKALDAVTPAGLARKMLEGILKDLGNLQKYQLLMKSVPSLGGYSAVMKRDGELLEKLYAELNERVVAKDFDSAEFEDTMQACAAAIEVYKANSGDALAVLTRRRKAQKAADTASEAGGDTADDGL